MTISDCDCYVISSRLMQNSLLYFVVGRDAVICSMVAVFVERLGWEDKRVKKMVGTVE